MSLEDVIARLKQATAGNNDLDDDIWWVVASPEDRARAARLLPHYTTSLDAAMTLLPGGAVFKVMTDYGDLCRASVSRDDPPIYTDDIDAATPALALCIACLYAKAVSA